RRAEAALVRVDRRPLRGGDQPRPPLAEPGRGRFGGGAAAGPLAEVAEEAVDGRLGALLVRPDDPARPALDPPCDVLTGAPGDAALVVRDHAAGRGETQGALAPPPVCTR